MTNIIESELEVGSKNKAWHLPLKPFSVQLEATHRSLDKYGLLMEMGMGKTAVCLNDFIHYHIQDRVDGIVVICPNSLKLMWKEEAEKCNLDIEVYVWPEIPDKLVEGTKPFMLTVNYEAVGVGKGEDFLERLMKARKCMLVLDESVCIKNHRAKRTTACLRLRHFTAIRRILTGAPITQSPSDLWPQLTFLDAIPGFKQKAFHYSFCKLGGFMNQKVVGVQNEDYLNQILQRCSFRARKQDWLDLPEKLYAERYVELTSEQKKRYMDLEVDFYTYIEESGQEVSAEIVLTKLIKLQQITSGFIIADSGEIVELDGSTRKINEVENVIEECGKVVVFCLFDRSMDILVEHLAKYKPAQLRGKAKMDDKGIDLDDEKRRFNTDPECKVAICQIASAKYGHTLIGSKGGGSCSTVIYYENSYSLDNRLQSEDRIHRLGQENSCLYIDFVSCPLDRAIIRALQMKLDIATAVVDVIRKVN